MESPSKISRFSKNLYRILMRRGIYKDSCLIYDISEFYVFSGGFPGVTRCKRVHTHVDHDMLCEIHEKVGSSTGISGGFDDIIV